jgi:hypothetical protein
MIRDPKGSNAARLHKKKFDQIRSIQLPIDGLPGSIVLNYTKCGKPSCHCATDEGHPSWLLSYSFRGERHVERIPKEWVEEVQRRVEAGRAFKDAIAEIFAANAELLVLARQQRRRKRR